MVFRHSRCPHPFNQSRDLPKAWVARHSATLEASSEPLQYADRLPTSPSSLKNALNCLIAVVLSQKVPKGEKRWNPLDAKQKSALELYDDLREKAGFDGWDVAYHSKTNGAPTLWMQSMTSQGFTLARSIDRNGQSVTFDSSSTTQSYPCQCPHPPCKNISAIEHQ